MVSFPLISTTYEPLAHPIILTSLQVRPRKDLPLYSLMMRNFFKFRVSRTAVVSSATAVAKLTSSISELVSFAPTKCAAEVVLGMLEVIKAVGENDEARMLLIKRVVDVLLLIREHFDETSAVIPPNLGEKMQEFELVLMNIYEKLRPAKKGFFRRALFRDKIKSDLNAHSATLDAAIGKLNLSLLLGVTVTTQMTLSQSNRLEQDTKQELALVQSSRDPDEEFLERVGSLYDEVRISDIRLVPPDDETERSFATFTGMNYALVRGEKRLIKSFDGDDEEERKNWIREVRHWHKLKHPNVLQLQGITNRASPHLYVVFQNGQARCLATYLIQALKRQDVSSIAVTIVKMMNAALSAVKHVRSKLRVDEATSVLAMEDATLALDAGNNLLVSINPPMQKHKGTKQVSLVHTVQEMLWPPMESRNVLRYLKRLKSTQETLGIYSIKTSDIRTAVNAFLADHAQRNDSTGEHFLSPKLKPGWSDQPIFSASIDCGRAIKAGDYGVLLPGIEEDFMFQPYGSMVDNSPGILSTVTETKLPEYTGDGLADIVHESPRIWRSDLEETRKRGFSSLKLNWYHLQSLTEFGKPSRFLVNSLPFLQYGRSHEDLVLITKVTHVKEYRFLMNDAKSDDDLQIQNVAGTEPPLPFVYATEPESPEDELQFSQVLPVPSFLASLDETWDPRVTFQGKERELKRIRYIRIRREDIVKRYGYVPAFKSTRKLCNAGEIIRKNQKWCSASREYELVVERSPAWSRVKAISKEV